MGEVAFYICCADRLVAEKPWVLSSIRCEDASKREEGVSHLPSAHNPGNPGKIMPEMLEAVPQGSHP